MKVHDPFIHVIILYHYLYYINIQTTKEDPQQWHSTNKYSREKHLVYHIKKKKTLKSFPFTTVTKYSVTEHRGK